MHLTELTSLTSLALCTFLPLWLHHLFLRSPVFWAPNQVTVGSCDEQVLTLLKLCALKRKWGSPGNDAHTDRQAGLADMGGLSGTEEAYDAIRATEMRSFGGV